MTSSFCLQNLSCFLLFMRRLGIFERPRAVEWPFQERNERSMTDLGSIWRCTNQFQQDRPFDEFINIRDDQKVI